MALPTPPPAIAGIEAYRVPRHPAPLDLWLDGIGGLPTPPDFFEALADHDPSNLVQHYPETTALTHLLASRLGLSPDRVIATAGGDDALDRAIRSLLCAGRKIIVPTPTFEMIARYTQWTGATLIEVPWHTETWPLEDVLAHIDVDTAAIAVVSPNNPTGAVITQAQLTALSEAAPHAVLLVDLAYVEFADHDLTALVASLPQAIGFRTLSKAWGLAGLRVGYAFGPAELIRRMRAAGNPYTVTGPSAALAKASLESAQPRVDAYITQIKAQRDQLASELHEAGIDTARSQANFVFGRTVHALWLRDALAGLGIGVRTWPSHPTLGDAVRINVPASPETHRRLVHGVRTALRPEALIFDLDGVLADVSTSYRRAIIESAASFGVRVCADDITAIKAEGDANNDWILTHKLITRGGKTASLAEVTERFEALYQGTPGAPGFERTEKPLLSFTQLEAFAARFPLAVVTGRPRADALRFLDRHGLTPLFDTIVCMEDAPLKPDPAPVRLALAQLRVTRAWMVGDTVDDVRAARAAGVLPLAIPAPGEDWARVSPTLLQAGAARVLHHLPELLELS